MTRTSSVENREQRGRDRRLRALAALVDVKTPFERMPRPEAFCLPA
jgi:hypothetical protein